MRHFTLPAWCMAIALAQMLAGCASLQIDVDVYKGPLAHEKEIQVRQYASLATSAKPLLEDLYLKERIVNGTGTGAEPKPLPCEKKTKYREKSLCEILSLFDDDPQQKFVAFRAQSRHPERGLDTLTFAVTSAMAQPAGGDRQPKIDEAVAALNEALIFFAQKMLYLTNSELLFRESSAANKETGPMLSVLQSLGNTILVHANDLQRQQTQAQLHFRLAESEHASVQQAFQPPPSVTMDAILTRLQRYDAPSAAAPAAATQNSATAEQKTALEQVQADYRNYLATIQTLLAAYRTINAELTPALARASSDAVDLLSAQADRQAIAALYASSVPPVPAIQGRKPLEDWIDRELASKVVTSPERPERLQRLKEYLRTESALLDAAGAGAPAPPNATLAALKAYLAAQVSQAAARAQTTLAGSVPLQRDIDELNQQEAVRVAALAKKAAADNSDAVRTKTVAVVTSVRPDVIANAERIHTRDPKVITNLLLDRLRELVRTAKGGTPSVNDMQLTIHIVEGFTIPDPPCSSSSISRECRAATTVDVVDKLISSLRAQRVQAVAAGDTAAADNLLKAINVANDQRTAMIYLRPASDYLRSVYSSSSLQEGTESEYRNMLTDWFKKYLNPFENDDKNLGRKEQEKINWQNVNKVTVSGGGFTNYVLAKDDVGNWYVKAYGSDPEAIIKSATSLALFNSGKPINVNLLRRFEAQRKLDDGGTLTTDQRADLNKDLAAPDGLGGQALLKVRDRYAERYARDTLQQASALLALVNEMPAKTDTDVASQAGWNDLTCPLTEAKGLVKPLDATYLAAPRTRLGKAVAAGAASAQPAGAPLLELEQSIQSVLTGMYLYSSDLPRMLTGSADTGCAVIRRDSAELARKNIRVQLTMAVTGRRISIERYEDALSNVLEIASAK